MANFHKSESSAAKDPSVVINKAENSDLTKKYAAVPSENTSILKDESSRNVKVTNPHYEKLEIPQEKPRPQIVREPFCPGTCLTFYLLFISLDTNLLRSSNMSSI